MVDNNYMAVKDGVACAVIAGEGWPDSSTEVANSITEWLRDGCTIHNVTADVARTYMFKPYPPKTTDN